MKFEVEVTSTINGNKWDSKLSESKSASTYQSYGFANAYKTTYNSKPIFILAKNNDGQIVGQLLAFIHSDYFWKDSNRFSKHLKKFIKFHSSLGWVYGPIIHDEKNKNHIISEILNSIEKIAYENNILIIMGRTAPLESSIPLEIFKKNNYLIKEWGTYIIDLQKSKEEIYKKMEKNIVRKTLKRSVERGVQIEEITDQNFKEYVDILNNFNIKTGRKVVSANKIQDHLKPIQPTVNGFLTKINNIPTGGMMFFYFNNYITEEGVARTKIDETEKFYSQDLIKLKIIEWGIKNKLNYYDLSGFNPNFESKKEEGIMLYKKKWGGTKLPYFIMTKIPNKTRYQLIRTLMNPEKLMSKIHVKF